MYYLLSFRNPGCLLYLEPILVARVAPGHHADSADLDCSEEQKLLFLSPILSPGICPLNEIQCIKYVKTSV
jgi:hypothetical protein